MDGEPLELSMVGFADRGECNHGWSQLVSCWRGFESAVLVYFLPRVFQRSLNQAAGLRTNVFGNFVEGHDLTSPVRSGAGSSFPRYVDDRLTWTFYLVGR